MADETQALLDAEQAVQAVLKELAGVKREAEAHEEAQRALAEVRRGLEAFLQHTTETAKHAGEAVAVLKSLGMPEVLSRIAKIRSDLDAGAAGIQRTIEALGGDLRGQSAALTSDIKKEMTQATGQMQRDTAAVVKVSLEQLRSEFGRLVTRLGEAANRMEQHGDRQLAVVREGVAAMKTEIQGELQAADKRNVQSLNQRLEAERAERGAELAALGAGIKRLRLLARVEIAALILVALALAGVVARQFMSGG